MCKDLNLSFICILVNKVESKYLMDYIFFFRCFYFNLNGWFFIRKEIINYKNIIYEVVLNNYCRM